MNENIDLSKNINLENLKDFKKNIDNVIDSLNKSVDYNLPIATTETLGGVKVDGTTVTINDDGVISATTGGGGGSASEKPINYITVNGTFSAITIDFANPLSEDANICLLANMFDLINNAIKPSSSSIQSFDISATQLILSNGSRNYYKTCFIITEAD